ncbi:MAG: hypothetical protein PHI53_02810 [Candidatus Pacebacteria bacterium]|nr:hypothetical protein [Candidatus Paceibacterota bacterium]
MKKKTLTFIALVVIIIVVVLVVWAIIYSKNKDVYNGVSELSDKQLLDYAKSRFDKGEMMGRDIIIGYHYGIPVRVTFPCSDVCPDYTIRIIRYDVELDKCEEVGGIKKAIYVPFAEAMIARGFCFPKVIVSNGIYEFAEDWNLLIEELENLSSKINYCNEKSDCSYKILDNCYIPVMAFNKNGDLTEFNKKFEEYKPEFPSCNMGKIKVDSLICEMNKCILSYSLQE